MKTKNFSDDKIVAVLKDAETMKVEDVIRKHGISTWTFYRWKKRYTGVQQVELRRMRELEAENQKLKRLVANLSMDNLVLKDVIAKKL
jgi:putative transposase